MGLNYFGYFGSGYIGGGDQHGKEIADHADLGMVYWASGNVPGSVETIRQNAANGLRVILNVCSAAWHTSFEGGTWTLRADGAIWDALDQAITAAGLWPNVAAFYHIDEPFSRTSIYGTNRPKDDVAADVRIVNTFLASRKPDLPRIVCFAYTELYAGHGSEMTADSSDAYGYDVVAFDLYSDTTHWDNHLNDPRLFAHSLNELKRRCPGKPIMLVPDAAMWPGDTQDRKLARINAIYDIAKSDPQIVGMLGYSWNDRNTGTQSVRNLPWMLERYTQIGKEITGK
jgi:hypothetical protein